VLTLGVRDPVQHRTVSEELVVAQLALRMYGWRHADPARAHARQLLVRWLGLGLPCRERDGHRWFDLAEVENFAQARDRETWVRDLLPAKRRSAEIFPEADKDTARSHPSRFRVELRRQFSLAGRAPGSKVRLSMPMPCEDAAQTEIAIEVLNDDGARIAIQPGHLEARLEVPDGDPPIVTIEVAIDYVAWLERALVDRALTTPDLTPYLRPHEGFIRVTPYVESLAAQLAANHEPLDVLARFWEFFFEKLQIGRVHHDELDAEDPLRSAIELGWSDCFIASSLMAALCRARGMPARLVHGLTLYPEKPGNHYWVEVWVPPHGWFPMDFASVGLAANDINDPRWARYFFGTLNYRLKLARLPLERYAPVGVRYPAAWTLVESPCDGGVEHTVCDRETLALIYRDRLRVTWLP
jgi:transglutaminase-like putative cysteine protease